MEAGKEFNITPYGTEMMHLLRVEKGFIIVGQDTDATLTPIDLQMDWIVSKRNMILSKDHYIDLILLEKIENNWLVY